MLRRREKNDDACALTCSGMLWKAEKKKEKEETEEAQKTEESQKSEEKVRRNRRKQIVHLVKTLHSLTEKQEDENGTV